MRKVFLTLVALLLLSGSALAAGSVATSSVERIGGPDSDFYLHEWTFTADASDGSFVSKTTVNLNGYIMMAETEPGAVTPTANYDIVVNNVGDATGTAQDIFGGTLANRSDTAIEQVKKSVMNYGPLTITLSGNSVNSAVVVFRLYFLKF